jgi:hypothetical protein
LQWGNRGQFKEQMLDNKDKLEEVRQMLHQVHAKLFESTCQEPKAEKNVTMNILSLDQDLRTHISPAD